MLNIINYYQYLQFSITMKAVEQKHSLIKTPIIIGAVTALAGLSLYFLYKKLSTPKVSTIVDENQYEEVKETNQEFDHRYNQAIHMAQQHFDGKNITEKAIEALYQAHYYLAQFQYRNMVRKSRKDRRAKINDKIAYAQIVTKFQLQSEDLLDKKLDSVLARFNFPKDSWMKQLAIWAQNQDPEAETTWQSIIDDCQNQQLLSLCTQQKYYTNSELEKFLKFKLKTLQQLDFTKLYLEGCNKFYLKFQLIDKYLNDQLYFKFKVEEQYIHRSAQKLRGLHRDNIDQIYDDISDNIKQVLAGLGAFQDAQDNDSNEQDNNYILKQAGIDQ